MRKYLWKSFLTVILVGSMSASICACTKKDDVAQPVIEDVQLDLTSVVSSADSAVAKNNMYEPVDLEYYYADGKAISYNDCSRVVNNKLNIVSTVYDSTVGYSEIVLSRLGSTASDITSATLDIPDKELYVSDDIVDLVDRNYASCIASGFDVNDIQTKYQCSVGYNNFFINSDGCIYGVVNYSFYFYSAAFSESYSSYASIVCYWDNFGTLKWHKQLPQSTAEQSLYIEKAVVSNEVITLAVSSSETQSTVYKYNKSGELVDNKTITKDSDFLKIVDLITIKNGEDIAFFSDSYGKTNAAYYNSTSLSFGNAVSIPDTVKLYGYKAVSAGINEDFVFSTSYGLYGCNIGDSELKIKMDYVNSDFDGYYIKNLCLVDNNSFYGTYTDIANKNSITAVFKTVNASQVSDKAIIRLATYKLTSETREKLLEYNTTNDVYRVVVEEYSLYDKVDTPNLGIIKLEEVINSDSAPDLVVCDPGLINTYSLANNSKLIPWNYLVNSDSTFKGSDYMTFVMDAYAINGLDYILVYDYIYRTFIGNSDIVGNNTTWTVNDMTKLTSKAPSGNARLYQTVTRDDFLSKMIKFNTSEYIDYENKTTSFNSNDFIKLIEYAAKLSNEVTVEDYNIDIGSYYRSGDILLIEENVNDSDDFWQDAFRYFDGNASVVGFPSSTGTSSIVEYVDTPIMIINGNNISGAWNFTKCFFDPDYQYSLENAIPVYEDAFYGWGNEAIYNQNYVGLNELGEPNYVQDTYFYNNHEYEIPAITSENIADIENQIKLTSKAAFSDKVITDVIIEEVEKYFANGQSSKDAAKNIDSRVKAYLFE